MSKKILKRSLALGALMAFVITGSAMAAELTIDGGYLGDSQYLENGRINGAYSNSDVIDNSLSVVNAHNIDSNNESLIKISAGFSQDGSANGNTLTLSGVSGYVALYGGNAGVDAKGNSVFIKLGNSYLGRKPGVTNSLGIFGGYAYKGNAEDNAIYVEGGTTGDLTEMLYGGYAQVAGNATNNKVVIDSGNLNISRIFGGLAGEGDATLNQVIINGGDINPDVDGYRIAGGESQKGKANENTVTITGGVINNNVYGGYGSMEANDNIVDITGGDFGSASLIYGGYTGKGFANNNQIVLTNTEIKKKISGGWTDDGAANENFIKLDKAYGSCSVLAGVSTNADAVGNRLEIILGDKDLDLKGPDHVDSYGGNAYYGDAKENQIIINAEGNGNLTGRFYGGASFGSVASDSIGNKVVINSGYLDKVTIHGGFAYKDAGNALKNELIIKGGTLITDSSNVFEVAAGRSYSGEANENEVTVSGGTIEGSIYAGYGATASNDNIVDVSGSADISSANLYGGNVANSTGNTLNIAADWSNSNVKSINNFNEINIEEAEWGTSAVEVESLALVNTTVNVDTVRVAGGDTTFAPNGSSVLISSGNTTGELDGGSVHVFKGVATIYDASVVKDGNDIKIQLGNEETAEYNAGVMNPQVLVIGESRAAATAFTNQGSELIETGLDALARDKSEQDTKVFASLYGNTSEYATGSEVKVNGWSGIVGVGKTNANGLTVGAFFENGEGNYRTYNDVNGEFMRGDGEACYNGGGLIVRKDNANGVYTEASLRAGNLQNELRNAVHGSDGLTGYDIDTFYYGAHVGVGKIIPRGNDGDSIDVYGKFIYTHHDSEDFTIDGDEFHFDSVDSERLRLGFRINEVQTNKLSMYYGAAWEYEFGGDSDNTVVGYDLSTPSLGGSTVIGELGMHYKASEKWSFDLNGRAYTGQRDGFSGSIQANYAF